MNRLRPSNSILRRFEPAVRRRCMHTSRLTPRASRPSYLAQRSQPSPATPWVLPYRRLQSTLTSGGEARTAQEAQESEDRWANTPAYEMTFTCKQCTTRSSHKISKQGYHHGTVLITCPGCKNKHLISDHLKIFSDKRITLEDIMKDKGQLVKRGTLSSEGDVEFWDDGTEVKRDAKS